VGAGGCWWVLVGAGGGQKPLVINGLQKPFRINHLDIAL
jgi:hypothetical protein